MRKTVLTIGAGCALLLTACDNPKPRVVPPDPMAATPTQEEATPPPTDGLSAGLTKRAEMAGFTLDRIGAAPDPLNRRPALTPAGAPVVLDGFGFDPVAQAPGKGVDVVVDGRAYGAAYGRVRPDVATYFKNPALAAVGFATQLPAGALSKGPHEVVVRVVAADGKSYFESPMIPFEVR